jgi:Ca-activated chloride channel homolog
MSRHRALRGPEPRGIAKWPIVALAMVLLVALGWMGWSYAGGVLERQAAAELASCTEGEATLTVAVTPSLADVIGRAAATWTRTHPVVMDHCVRTEVAATPPQDVLDGLTAGWDVKALGERPGAWLPESSLWINRLSAQDARLLGSEPASIATSPVLLAMPEHAAAALREASSFSWGDLPDLVSDPTGWQRLGHPDWGRFTVAMPDVAANPASALALQSVLADASPKAAGPVTVDMLSEPAVTQAMAKLAAATPVEGPVTTGEALDALSGTDDLKAAPFDAVPALEFDLYRHNLGAGGHPVPASPLVGEAVGGPTPTADFPYIAITDQDADQFQVRAAQKFREYLQSDAQQLTLAKAGLRVPSTKVRPNPAPGIRWTVTQLDLTAADANTTQQISAAWTNAGGSGQVVTVLVDVSRSMLEDGGDGRNRLVWVQAALRGQVARFGSGSLGLWTFSKSVGPGGQPYRQLVDTAPVTENRDKLDAAIKGIEPDSATYLYPSLLAVYDSAQQHYQQGRQNRIVVITDGPDDSQLSYADFTSQLGKHREGKPDLAISFISIGNDPDQEALTEVAKLTGGTFATVKDGTGVEAALGQLLSS